MDKNAIKKYAVWARNELIARVTQKAEQYEITEKKTTPKDADSINGRLLTDAEKNQRKALIEKIQADGFEQVMEEVAYTWFNRFTALRFMEVNNYLPSHTRVFTNEAGEFKPQILADAIQLDLEGLDMDKVFELKDANKTEELYKYLLITQCNALSAVLPRMFQKIEHYTELLLPDYLLREGSVIEQMITLIPEEDWTDQVQIIGWLYQYYNTELNEFVYDGSYARNKIAKELLPAATTIYTPDWAVHYMVENSLGRLWMEGHPNNSLRLGWKYYLDEAEQEADVQKKLDKIRKEYAKQSPEELRCIDPCMGSGHILCYMFDVLIKIYEDYGYTAREAVEKIVVKNIWGLDIDERAAQLSYFAVMMKARQYDRRFFTRNIQPHVYVIKESNGISLDPMHNMGIELSPEEHREATEQAMRLVEELGDAKEYGSIIHVTPCNWELLRRFAVPREASESQMMLDLHGENETAERLQNLIDIGEALGQKYDVVVTNPPYLGSSRFSPKLDAFIKKRYKDVKADLSMVMFKQSLDTFVKKGGFIAFITTSSWMYLSSFEQLRAHIISDATFSSLVDFGTELFEGKVGHNPIVSWVIRKEQISDYRFRAIRLVEYCYSRRDEKEPEFFDTRNHHLLQQKYIQTIPGMPIAYWLSKRVFDLYSEGKTMESCAHPKVGMQTSNNDKYLRMWYEVNYSEFEGTSRGLKWIKYLKGGACRKWYGNLEYLLRYNKDPQFILQQKNARVLDLSFLDRKKCTWTDLTSGMISFRYAPEDTFYDISGHCFFPSAEDQFWLLAYANSKIFAELKKVFNSTFHCQVGDVSKIVVPELAKDIRDEISRLSESSVEISKSEWDSFETSWEFSRHPLITTDCYEKNNGGTLIKDQYEKWKQHCDEQFSRLKANEEKMNSIFIDVYGLQEEMEPCVDDKDITLRKADLQRDIRSLISYAVGCMFGRYSLDLPGLIYAGGKWDSDKYRTYLPDKDAIIPICDDEYFDDDIVGRFIDFIKVVYGENTLEDNLQFIAAVIGGRGSSRDIIRSYFINDFYADHLKVYQKRPIYWLFDSGKKNGFKCLVYMHRYQPDTIARIRTDYVHEQQSRYRTAISGLEKRINDAGTSERVKLNKQLSFLQDQEMEIREYEEKIHHLADQMINIDLDDGVKHNYEIFKDVLARI